MTLTVVPLGGMPEVTTGADLAALLAEAVSAGAGGLQPGDVLVVSSKIVSKALGLRAPQGRTREELVLEESARVVVERRLADGRVTRVVEALAGPVMMAAGIDASNTGPTGELLLLPRDPDAVAAELLAALRLRSEVQELAVLLTDTAGRAWRGGLTDLALGCAGLQPLEDHRSGSDADGRPLSVTVRAVADELAAAADLVKGKAHGIPAALVRGCPAAWLADDAPGARALVRTGPSDWFRLGHVEAVRAALGAVPGTAASAHVGVPSATDALLERVCRVVALALLGLEDVGVDLTPGVDSVQVEIATEDAFALGQASARVDIAAWSEDVTVAWSADRRRATVTAQPGR